MFVLLIITLLSVEAIENGQRDPATDQVVYFKKRTEGPVGISTTSSGKYMGETMEEEQGDPATYQVVYFKERTEGPVGVLTTSSGASVPYCEATNTFNTRLINNEFFMDTITHLNRERIPERVVHALGTGAFGYFEVTHDISHICKASFLKYVGKKTPVVVRFSTALGEKGNADATRDVRGFATKFYTDVGNFDIPGFNTPMFFLKDPVGFSSIVHAAKRNPATNLIDPNTFWDFLTLNPESLQLFMLVFADRTTPASYRNMPGYGIHTYQVENKYGEKYFLRFHILPDDGIKNLPTNEAKNISFMDPDYLSRDLFRSIANGDFLYWTVSVQILTKLDIKKNGPKLIDVTRTIPLDEYPLHPIGKLVLNRNPKNFFAEIEQSAFCPANLVSGIHGGLDKTYESRRLAYRDAQYYRLGANFKKIPVNCPFQVNTFTYIRDGRPPVKDNEGGIPNYYLNSFHGPVPDTATQCSKLIEVIESKPYNFDQAAELYANELTTDERIRLVENLVSSLQVVTRIVKERAIKMFTIINLDLGNQLAKRLNITTCK